MAIWEEAKYTIYYNDNDKNGILTNGDTLTFANDKWIVLYSNDNETFILRTNGYGSGYFGNGSKSYSNYIGGESDNNNVSYYNNLNIKDKEVLIAKSIQSEYYSYGNTYLSYGGNSATRYCYAISADEAYSYVQNKKAAAQLQLSAISWTRTGHVTSRSTSFRPHFLDTDGEVDSYHVDNGGSYDTRRPTTICTNLNTSLIKFKIR